MSVVSTRGIKYKFCENEKVLCYEPDTSKAKVLYDSKVLDVVETKDKRGRRVIEYLIHFQGWRKSWDRRVVENYVLKDTEENRLLQKSLAEKSQLQIGAYLYRKERKKRIHKSSGSDTNTKQRRRSSDDGSFGSQEDYRTSDMESDSFSSSAESTNDEEKIVIKIGEKLKKFLEFDFDMITNKNFLVDLPAKTSVVTILQNFVKHLLIKSICCPKLENLKKTGPTRNDRKTIDFDKIKNSIDLSKEVADGLRLYFNFTIKNYLLYNQETDQMNYLLSEDYLNNFNYITAEKMSIDMLPLIEESPGTPGSEISDSLASCSETHEDNARRRLRSHRTDENEIVFDITGTMKQESIASASSENSSKQPQTTTSSNMNIFKSILPLNIGIPVKARELLKEILVWEILPATADPEPSMIYGAPHLARLLVKLPEFLNASSIVDEKLKILLQKLDYFIEFLEEHQELFGELMYKERSVNIKVE